MDICKISTMVSVIPQIAVGGIADLQAADYDMNGVARHLANGWPSPSRCAPRLPLRPN